ncbi:MAG: hypothetical protein MUO36_00335 [Candidatus Hadarchaeum sp.]|nr:hypothetical protein [Candidatus Hadarchaeum sp.]
MLIVWSILVIGFQFAMIGEYRSWLAWGGLVLGLLLLAYDVQRSMCLRRR